MGFETICAAMNSLNADHPGDHADNTLIMHFRRVLRDTPAFPSATLFALCGVPVMMCPKRRVIP